MAVSPFNAEGEGELFEAQGAHQFGSRRQLICALLCVFVGVFFAAT